MRLFTAVLPCDSFRAELERLQDDLKEKGVTGRYTDSANLHLTLVFIGEYGDPEKIMDLLEEIPMEPVFLKPLRIEKLKDLYILRFEENEELNLLVSRMHRSFAENRIPFDRKSFLPHITLLRKAERDLEEPMNIPDSPMECDAVSLMHSKQGKNGMVYTEIGRLEIIQ